MAKKTASQRLADVQAQIAKLQVLEGELAAKVAAGDTFDAVEVGQSIQFVYGRGEGRKTYSGVVLGVGKVNGLDRIKVQAGEGFDVNIYTIDPSAIQVPEEQRTAPADQTATETPVAGTVVTAQPTAAQAAHEAAVSEAEEVDPAASAASGVAADPMAGI